MARPEDSAIEQALRRVVTEVYKQDERISVKSIRALVVKELQLQKDFFLNVDDWKQKSKNIIEEAFENEEQAVEAPGLAVQPVTQTPDSASSQPQDHNNAKKQNYGAAKIVESTTINVAKKDISDERVKGAHSGHRNGGQDADNSEDVHKATTKRIDKPRPVNGVKRKADQRSDNNEKSESEDESSSEEGDDVQTPEKKKARTDASSSSGEGDDSSSEDESDDQKESEKRSEAAGESPVKPSYQVAPIPAKAFVPPSGFAPIAPELLHSGAELNPYGSEGKQTWHIVAPTGLPISSITGLSLDALRSGQTILAHNGIDYVLSEHDERAGETLSLLLPAEGRYKFEEQQIERSLHLQQKISLPNLTIRQVDQNAGSAAAVEVGAPPISYVRPQPKGLRMRYKPPGSGPGRPSIPGSGSEFEDVTVHTNAQTGLTQDVDAIAVNEDAPARTTKKSKKKQKPKDVDEAARPMGYGVVSKSMKTNPASKAPVADGVLEETMSKEELKSLKRQRKEAKQKANR